MFEGGDDPAAMLGNGPGVSHAACLSFSVCMPTGDQGGGWGASRRLGQAAACPRFLAQSPQRLRAQGWGLKMLSAERLERILGGPCGWTGGPVRCEAPTRNGAQPEALPQWCSPRCQDREHRQANADPCDPTTDLRRPVATAGALPNPAVLDQGGTATRRRGPALASASALGRPGRRAPAPSHRHVVDQPGPSAQRAVLDGAVFLGDSLSRSRPPCLGRSLRSGRMRSASPNLDPTASRKDSAPIEEEAAD